MNALTRQSDSEAAPDQMARTPERASAHTPPRISVVTCAYSDRRWDALVDGVASAQAQDPPPDEIVVVIDHNEELLTRARRHLPRARVVANEESSGLSGARNTGVRHATGEIVAFLDDDARALPGWLQALARAFEDPTVIGAGGVAIPVWESRAPSWIPSEFLWVVGCSYRGLPLTRGEIRNPIGANMAFRRSVLDSIGGFTDGIGRVGRTPLGCEETELSIRARAATGGRIVQIPDAEVEHRVSPDRTRWRYFRRRCWAEGLSKAVVTRSVGSDAALERERSYVMRTLPSGVARGLADAFSGDRSGVGRSGAIVAGLLITAAGYLLGLISTGRARSVRRSADAVAPAIVRPVWSGELELSNPSVETTLPLTQSGVVFEEARLLIRVLGEPLGFVQTPLCAGKLDFRRALSAMDAGLRERVEAPAGRETDSRRWRTSSANVTAA